MDGLLLLPVSCLLIFLHVLLKKLCRCKSVYGPRWYPLVGSLFSFWKNKDRLLEWQTEMLQRSPTQTIMYERLGGVPTVVTANPANVEHMVKTKFDNYPKGEPFSDMLHDLLGRGIFNADGEAWKLQRLAANHEFNTRSLRNFTVEVVKEVTGRLLPLLRDAAERGRPMDLQDVLRRLAFDTICKVAFGVDPACLDPALTVSNFVRAFDVATELSARRAAAPVSAVWKAKRLLDVGSERRLREAAAAVHGFAMDVVHHRRKEIAAAGPDDPPRLDLLSRFMDHLPASGAGRSEEFLRDSIVSFILAGRDTTSAALTWFFWLLTYHPSVEDAIRLETARLVAARPRPRENPWVFSYEELQSMQYLHAAICESMRLYPPVPFDSKHALRDDVLPDGTFVRKGTRVTYHPYAMGRMKSIWGSDCLEFRPERWLNEEGAFVSQSPFKYAVFQAGPRVCLGKDMAFIQMKYTAAAVIANFKLRAVQCDRSPKCVSNLTCCMVGGFPIVVDTYDTAVA